MDPPVIVIREPGRSPLHLLLREPLEVGRDCSGVLIADLQASRRHVILAPRGGEVEVTDLGSTNGTMVDDRRLDGPHRLAAGQVVRIGATTIERVDAVNPRAASTSLAVAAEMRSTSIDLVAAAVVQERPAVPPFDGTGTVTIVFSDIENSTVRAVELGDSGWMEVLEVHNAIVRRHVARHRGFEVKSQGDGFMLAFPSARAALDAMVEAQRALDVWARSQPAQAVRVRIGIHTGEVILGDDGDLYGKHVVIAARVGALARGGEILVSSLVREIVEARGDLRFGTPRTVALKGLDGEWIVHPLAWRAGDQSGP